MPPSRKLNPTFIGWPEPQKGGIADRGRKFIGYRRLDRSSFAGMRLSLVELSIRLTSKYLLEDKQNSMANHYSALKRARQTEKKTAANRANKSRLRSALRSMREAIAKGDKDAAKSALSAAASAMDKGVQKGVLHKNTASRYKARLNKRVKAVGAK